MRNDLLWTVVECLSLCLLHHAIPQSISEGLKGEAVFFSLQISMPESLVPPQPLLLNPILLKPLANLSNQNDHLPITALLTGVDTIKNIKDYN